MARGAASASAIGVLGGTGAQGFGLALRFAAGGETVLIGSRSRERAVASAEAIRAAVPGAKVEGAENREVLDRVTHAVLSVPFEGLADLVRELAPGLAGKLVIDVVVPLVFHDKRIEIASVPEGSAGELVQRAVPGARVVSAFKNISAERLRDLSQPLEGDVLICGDDKAARAEVAGLVGHVAGLRPVDAGPLANTRHVEGITALLLTLNRRHKAITSVKILGLP